MSDAVRDPIIALEKAALTRWCSGDPMGFVEIAAEEIVYFDPFAELRVDGLAAFRARMESIVGQVHAEHFELINPVVQVHGEVAVLAFNYRSWSGTRPEPFTSRWNSTEVYARQSGPWRLIQSHWSMTTPQLKEG